MVAKQRLPGTALGQESLTIALRGHGDRMEAIDVEGSSTTDMPHLLGHCALRAGSSSPTLGAMTHSDGANVTM